jgi:hypothetical protein
MSITGYVSCINKYFHDYIDFYCTVRVCLLHLEKREAKQTKMGRSELRSDQLHRGKKGSNKDKVSKREGKEKGRYEDRGGNQYRE